MRKLVIIFAAILIGCMASTSRGQRLDGALRVNVTDETGAAVTDATVTVTNEATNTSVRTSSSSDGTYVFPNLLVSTYSVSVEKQGFKKYISKDVQVNSNQTTDVLAKLELGAVDTTIEVSSGAQLVQTDTSQLGSTFGELVVKNVPIATLGGDVKELAIGMPNTTTQPGGVLGSGGSIGGMRPRFNGFSIDGVDDNKADVNGPIQPVIQDSVAEFTLLTNQFSAEYGHSAGGQFNTVTKAGSNNWHGEAHEWVRNRKFNAADNIEKANGNGKNRFDYNRYGASVGGPILRNRLFIFGAYERQLEGLAPSSTLVETPTAAGFAALAAMNPHPEVAKVLAQFPVAPTSDRSANCVATPTTPVFSCVNGKPIDVGPFAGTAPSFFNQHDFIINSDLDLGQHRLHGGVLYDKFRAPDVNQFLPQAQFLGTNAFDARKYIFTDVWNVSSTVVNDFRSSISRGMGPNVIPPSTFANFPNVEVDELGVNVGPESLAPQTYTQNTYQISDALTKVKGRHTLKGGVEWRHWITSTDGLPRARGEWDYVDLQSLVNDVVPNGANGALRGAGSAFFGGNYNAIYTYLQDDFKATRRLTLNLGLRYEYTGIPADENRQKFNAIADDPAKGLFFRAPKPDLNNFAPRFGFALDPRGNGKWAVRGGFGVAYDVIPNNFAINSLPPQLQVEQNPTITCSLPNAPAWCTNPAAGFLQTGGLLTVNVPPTTTAAARAGTQALVVDAVFPKVLTWTLSVQHEIMRNTSLELRYLGSHAVSLPAQIRLNSASAFDPTVPGGGIAPLPTYFQASDVPAKVTNPASTRQSFTSFLRNRLNKPFAVDGFLGNLTTDPPVGQSIYHSGSVDMIHRFSRGLYLRANYTYAKNIDNSTNELFSSRVNPRRPQDARNIADERGRSALDINHKLAVTWVYDLPNISSDNTFLKGALHGWEVTGMYLAQTGQPVTALSGTDANANGDSAGDRAILNPSGTGLTGTGVQAVCNDLAGGGTRIITNSRSNPCASDAFIVGYLAVDPKARFVQAELGAKSNLGRNTVSTPGLNIWNIAVMKNTKFGERFTTQFRAETYNTFNHRNFSIGLPSNNGSLDATTNANPLSASYPFVVSGSQFLNSRIFNGGSRTMQLGLKIVF